MVPIFQLTLIKLYDLVYLVKYQLVIKTITESMPF